MAIAPLKKADLVEISHPGFKVVYHKPDLSKAVVVPHTVADIDAHEAVARFPKHYSLTVPDDHEAVPAAGGYDPFSPAPTPIASQATGGADTSVGHGSLLSDQARAEAARIAAAEDELAAKSNARDDAQKALDAAKAKGDDKATAKAQADFDNAKKAAADAQARLDALKN